MTQKSPFVSYTAEEILAIEAVTFVLQVGSDMLEIKGNWFFTKKSVNTYYNRVLREILDQLANGNKKQKRSAERALRGLRVLPLRIH